MECVAGLIHRDPGEMPRRWRGRELLRPPLGALGSAPIQGGDGPHTGHPGERLGGPRRSGLERRALVVQAGLSCRTQVFDEMQSVDHLHGRGSPLGSGHL
jgi:hypothetical protein